MAAEGNEEPVYPMKECVEVLCTNCFCKQKHIPTGEVKPKDCFNKTTKVEVRCNVCLSKKWVEEQIFKIKSYEDENNDASRM